MTDATKRAEHHSCGIVGPRNATKWAAGLTFLFENASDCDQTGGNNASETTKRLA
jgi:hypothetical protein